MTSTTIPAPTANCIYCAQPLTSNEYDWESGGYYSAHARCSQPAPEGRFQVATARFTTLARAEREARYLAGANHRSSFLVFDHAKRRMVAHASMGKEERRRWTWRYSPELAAEVRMPRPAIPMG